MSDFYSNIAPNLLDVNNVPISDNVISKTSDYGNYRTISEKICNMMSEFYDKFIKENKLTTLSILVVIALLIYRYLNKKENDEVVDDLDNEEDHLEYRESDKNSEIKEHFSGVISDSPNPQIEKNVNFKLDNHDNIDLNVERKMENVRNKIKNQTSHLLINNQPTFNPLYPINTKEPNSNINYLPDYIPIYSNGRVIYEPNKEKLNIINGKNLNCGKKSCDVDVDKSYGVGVNKYSGLNDGLNNLYKNPSLSYYTGLTNSYSNVKDMDDVNQLGYSNAFNSSTGSFVNSMIHMNKRNVNNYGDEVNFKKNNMINNVK